MNDPEQQAVYDAERDLTDDAGPETGLDFDTTRRLIEVFCKQLVIPRPTIEFRPSPKDKMGVEGTFQGKHGEWEPGKITFYQLPGYMLIAHELGHFLSPMGEGHGAIFRGQYIRSVSILYPKRTWSLRLSLAFQRAGLAIEK